jgi:hypothetical protein
MDRLYQNQGDGTFRDISADAGLQAATGNGLGVLPLDVNGDGWPDVAVANDGTANSFLDMAPRLGVAVDSAGVAKAGMGIDAVDLDGDLDQDLLIVNLDGETDSLFRNEGEYFSDWTAQAGLAGTTRSTTRFGVALADFDNDSYLDLFEANGRVSRPRGAAGPDPYAEPNQLLRGTAEGRFEPQPPPGGTDPVLVATSRGAAFGDVDGDGGLDVLVVNRDGPAHLLRNVVAERGHWLSLRLLDGHGRDALGAQVTLHHDGRPLLREVRSAYSYQSANDPRVHLGLGASPEVSELSVRWPDGQLEAFPPPAVDAVTTLSQGQGRALPAPGDGP